MTKSQRFATTSPKTCVIKVTIILQLMHKVFTIIYLFNFSKYVKLLHFVFCRKMGRYNKRIQAAKRLKNEKNLSSSAVAKTLANNDKDVVQFSSIDIIKNANAKVNLLLDNPSKKNLVSKAQTAKVNKISKKDKMKLRQNNLKQRLEVMKMVKDEEKAAKKRKKKAITGDLKPIKSAISDMLDDILEEDEKKHAKKTKREGKDVRPVKQKKVQKQMLNDLAIFQQVMKHPQYSKNPFDTISTHIENKMLQEAME